MKIRERYHALETLQLQVLFLTEKAIRGLKVNPIQDGGAKRLPTSFSLVTSTIVGISPENFLISSFNPFYTLV